MQQTFFPPRRLFPWFKYAVYLALLGNVWFFFVEDSGAASVRLEEASPLLRTIEVFAQSIDTAAWVVLLLLFELETSFLSNAARHRRRVAWTLHGVRALGAIVIVNSLIGYLGKLISYLRVEPFGGDACGLVDAGWSLLVGLDKFEALSARNCAALSDGLFRLQQVPVLTEPQTLETAQKLALVDVVNSAAWILVVVLLEIDVRLQLRGLLRGWLLRLSAGLKMLTYAVLLLAAVSFGVYGDGLDFWDAFLWLVAFVFIEMNLFRWQEETEHPAEEHSAQPH